MASNVQTIRFRKPQKPDAAPTKPKNRHSGILQDQLRRAQKGPWVPSFATAFRVLLLMRVAGAMYSNIQDCDEVFNFWEPLHYLDRGYGFQTWETSPTFSIRSWAYILLHLLPAKLASLALGPGKRPSFFAVRIFLAFISSLCETTLYRTAVEKINYRVGRYIFFMLVFSSGLWSASTAFLPSTFAMYANTLAFAWSLEPTSSRNFRRVLFTTLAFATGAIVGWPFAAAVAIPFILEELVLPGNDVVKPEAQVSWFLARFGRLVTCAAVAALLFIPVVALDTLFYGRLTVVPWNIVKYNVFPDAARGPELYGTEPVTFYIFNLLLNFNVLVPFALLSLPALAITRWIDSKRLGDKPAPGTSSPFTLLAIRLAPVYVWLGILSKQPHKEERFMYPIYPMICFNAAVALYLIRGWFEVAFVTITKSPYKASRTSLFSRFTLSVISASIIFSGSRTLALWEYYHAPMTVAFRFETQELPRLLNATGHISLPPPPIPGASSGQRYDDDEERPRLDYSPLKEFGLRLCYGKEWYRFPGHYLIPDGIQVDWVKSEFDGMLPGHFPRSEGSLVDRITGTKAIPSGLNDLNRENPEFYVDVSTCDYLIDLDFPLHPRSAPHEPRYITDTKTWDKVTCHKFLDVQHSSLLTRTLWMPGSRWQEPNEFGEYCLLRHRENVATKERRHKVQAKLS
ncbi:glycosyltransferase family 22 protein [Panus rudis PR-1116 ss-1]|nr:glycosyltransferase family 22 protein [Panus rudis PR-1116 ss-1]